MKPFDAGRFVGGRWVPAIPLKAPLDVRWCCSHLWTPHVHENGMTSHVDYDCVRCGVGREFGAWPENRPDRLRRWLAQRIFPYGRAMRCR